MLYLDDGINSCESKALFKQRKATNEEIEIAMGKINDWNKRKLNIAIYELKVEDKKCCLYSLAKSKRTSVKLPVFTGERSECFLKFKKKEVEKGTKMNRVSMYSPSSETVLAKIQKHSYLKTWK